MKKIVSLNPEKLLEDKVIKDYHVDGNNLVITFKDDCKEYYYKEDGSYIKYDIPDGFEVDDLCDDEFAIIYNNNKERCCYLNKCDGSLIKGKFDDCEPFSGGLGVVKLKELEGAINKKGKIIVPIKYSFVSKCIADKIVAIKHFNNKVVEYIFDGTGNIVKQDEALYSSFDEDDSIKDIKRKIFRFDGGFYDYVNNEKFPNDICEYGCNLEERQLIYLYKNKYYIYDKGIITKLTFQFNFDNLVKKDLTNERYYSHYNDFVKKGDYVIYEHNNLFRIEKDGSVKTQFVLKADILDVFIEFNDDEFYRFLDKHGNLINTDYVEYIDKKDDLFLFKKSDNSYVIVTENNEIVKSFVENDIFDFIYNNKKYHCEKNTFYFEHDYLDIANIIISDDSKLLSIKDTKVRNYDINKDNINMNDEDELYFKIFDILNKLQIPILYDKLKNMVAEYEGKSLNIIASDIKIRLNNGIISVSDYENSYDLRKNYLKKLCRFYKKINHYFYIITVIDACINDKDDIDNELVNDVRQLKKICMMQDRTLGIKNINLLNSELNKYKNEIVDDILSYNDKFIFNNYKEFELNFRNIFHKLLTMINEEGKQELINEEIRLGKIALATNVNSKCDVIKLDIREIDKIVEYIESFANNKVIWDKLDNETKDNLNIQIFNKLNKYKCIQLDTGKSADENIKYVYDLLNEVLRLKIRADFIFDPLKNMTKIKNVKR